MSKQSHPILSLTLEASADISEHRFVDTDGSHTGADGKALGVAQYGVKSGSAFAADVLGTTVVEAGAAGSVDDPVSSDANGRAVVTDGTTYTVTLGRFLQAPSAAGEFVEVLLIPTV